MADKIEPSAPYEEFHQEQMKNPEFAAEYAKLQPEFDQIRSLVEQLKSAKVVVLVNAWYDEHEVMGIFSNEEQARQAAQDLEAQTPEVVAKHLTGPFHFQYLWFALNQLGELEDDSE